MWFLLLQISLGIAGGCDETLVGVDTLAATGSSLRHALSRRHRYELGTRPSPEALDLLVAIAVGLREGRSVDGLVDAAAWSLIEQSNPEVLEKLDRRAGLYRFLGGEAAVAAQTKKSLLLGFSLRQLCPEFSGIIERKVLMEYGGLDQEVAQILSGRLQARSQPATTDEEIRLALDAERGLGFSIVPLPEALAADSLSIGFLSRLSDLGSVGIRSKRKILSVATYSQYNRRLFARFLRETGLRDPDSAFSSALDFLERLDRWLWVAVPDFEQETSLVANIVALPSSSFGKDPNIEEHSDSGVRTVLISFNKPPSQLLSPLGLPIGLKYPDWPGQPFALVINGKGRTSLYEPQEDLSFLPVAPVLHRTNPESAGAGFTLAVFYDDFQQYFTDD